MHLLQNLSKKINSVIYDTDILRITIKNETMVLIREKLGIFQTIVGTAVKGKQNKYFQLPKLLFDRLNCNHIYVYFKLCTIQLSRS